jgi:hypothetical protein
VAACGIVVWRTGPTRVVEIAPAPATRAVEAPALTPAAASTAIQPAKRARRGRAPFPLTVQKSTTDSASPAALALRKAGQRNMAIGGIVFAVGILITAVTFLSAQAPGGGRYIIAWGAIIAGAGQFLRGLDQVSKTGDSEREPLKPESNAGSIRLRALGLASLPLGAMLLYARYIEPGIAATPGLWVSLWGIYAIGFLWLGMLKPWTWLDDTRLTFLVLQPVAMVAAFVGLVKDPGLPAGLWFVLFLTSVCFPLYFLFGEPRKSGSALDAPTVGRRLRWIGLSAAPSSLMLGVTTYLTTDIAAIPLFWVVPLALYLLTFILVFLRWPTTWTERPHTIVLWVQPVALAGLAVTAVGGYAWPAWLTFLLHLTVFFLTALVCHGELAKDRPSARYLTEFYLWMSVGGVLGGLFNGLIAPVAFQFGVVEYPLAVLLAIMLRPSLVGEQTLIPGDSRPRKPTDLGRALDLFFPLALGLFWFIILGMEPSKQMLAGCLILAGLLCLSLLTRPLRAALALTALVIAANVQGESRSDLLHEERGFFGFLRVRESRDVDEIHRRVLVKRTLYHGGINHGSQYIFSRNAEGEDTLLRPDTRRRLITYFTPASGIGQVFESFKGLKPAVQKLPFRNAQVWTDARLPTAIAGLGGNPYAQIVATQAEMPFAVVGLGLGTLAAQARPFQHMTFYEIDPGVIRLSEGKDPYFYYVKDARERGARVDFVVGDGRLTMRKAPERYYHIIVLDAFSGDAIPVHLLTDNAIKEYLTKLVDGGVLIFNATNRYIDLRPVLADLAEQNDMVCYAFGDWGEDGADNDRFSSDWVVLQRKFDRFRIATPDGAVKIKPGFSGSLPLTQQIDLNVRYVLTRNDGRVTESHWLLPEATGEHIWTDRYSNLLRVMDWRSGF